MTLTDYYVKSFGGWRGKPLCGPTTSGTSACSSGVDGVQLAEAKRVLSSEIDLVMVTEWLSSPGHISHVGKALCFANDHGKLPWHAQADWDNRTVPSFEPRSPFGGGTSKLRPDGWLPENSTTLRRLWDLNKQDLELFEWVSSMVRGRVADVEGAQAAAALPPTPPTSSVEAFERYLESYRAPRGHAPRQR